MKRYDAAALGELLIDFTESGTSPQGNPLLEANPGGAPGNVMAGLAKLGHQTGFIGKVGADAFGRQITGVMDKAGIDTAGVVQDPGFNTTLAFVHKTETGDRSFSFYRAPGADMMLRKEELRYEMLTDCRIFHFGTLSMTDEPVKSATTAAVQAAKNAGAVISFDPNIREALWHDAASMRDACEFGFTHADIVKISDNEIVWFTGTEDMKHGAEWLRKTYGIGLLLVSKGPDGSMAFSGDAFAEAPARLTDRTIETTGAGDTFMASVLHAVLSKGTTVMNETELKEMLVFANAAASVITTRKGALAVMPSYEEIKELLDS